MGSFTNSVYTNTINSLDQAAQSKLQNPYYLFTDKHPTPVTYYKQNKTKSTVDRGSKLQYAHVSEFSALRFNKILNFVLYGIDRINVDYDVGDNGLEAGAISGEFIVLPNTIEPTTGDFFKINYLTSDILFKVDSVTPDTIDSGATIYKCEYHLELTGQTDQIERQVVKVFNFIAGNVGTEFSCLLEDGDYNFINQLEELAGELATYYNNVFFKPRVQTYVYLHDGAYNFYDPFLIEFLRRNRVLDVNGEFHYVAHQTVVHRTFDLDYSKTIFYALEKGIKEFTNICTADKITQFNSLFTSRLEDYYQVNYMDKTPYKTRYNQFPGYLPDAIKNGSKPENPIYNLLVAYMNGVTDNLITSETIEYFRKLDFEPNQTLYYIIPIYIYIIKKYAYSLMQTPKIDINMPTNGIDITL